MPFFVHPAKNIYFLSIILAWGKESGSRFALVFWPWNLFDSCCVWPMSVRSLDAHQHD
jgi:hypothetical protein